MSFWKELKRRNVYKVGVAYAIVAWLIVQGTAIIAPALQLPQWTLPFIIILLSIGFLITLFLAWAYEVTPEGIKRTKEVPLSESITHLTGKKLNYILAGLLVIAVAFILFDNYYLDRRAVEQVPAVGDIEETPKTIAVLPFVNLSSDPEQEYFVDGLSEELLNSLAQIPGLNVAGRTSSFTFKDSDKTVQEIADVLGVENILEGSVRKAGNALRITAQLLRATDGFHLWSETYNRELKDIFAVQEDIATTVADELKVTLGLGKSLKQLGGTDNVEAYEFYLVAKGQMWTSTDTVNEIFKLLEAALAIDPNFALAWALKANFHISRADGSTSDRVASELDAALNAAQKAIELEPNLADAHLMLGAYRRVKGEWIEAELEYRKAMELTNEPIYNYHEYFLHYSVLGKFKRLRELLETAMQNDPLNKTYRDNYIWSLFLSGDVKLAKDENERAKGLFGDKWFDETEWFYQALGDKVSSDKLLISNLLVDNIGKKYIDSPKEGIAELRRIYNNTKDLNNNDLKSISLCAAYFGDSEFAMDSMERGNSISTYSTYYIWLPVMKNLRQTSRFKKFIKDVGLVDYWNEFGWPDICRQMDNGDFECD